MSRKLALIIGNSEYEDQSLARLITPTADVGDLASALRLPDVGGFDDVTTLVNASTATLRRSIAQLFAQKNSDDLLLLYFSGHGVLDDQGQLYLAVKDTERELLSGTAIPASFITGEMDRSRSRRQVLILDCCHSGAFARGAKGVVGASVGTGSAFEGIGYGRVVLTATDATQYAWEGDQVIGQAENSVFTRHLIEGIQTGAADVDADGRITLDELYDYVYGRVVSQTPKQTPGKWSYRQQGDIVIAKNPRPIVKPAELPIEIRQAIESPLASVREGIVRELDRLLGSSNAGIVQAAYEALKHLADDDSRRVSLAADASLAAYTEARHLRELAEADRLAAQRAEQERWAAQQAEVQHLDQQRAETERAAKAEQERIAREKLEADRLAAQKAAEQRLAQQRADAERAAHAEQERIEEEKVEQQRKLTELAKQKQAEVKQERLTDDLAIQGTVAVHQWTDRQRKALLAAAIVSIGWIANWLAGILVGASEQNSQMLGSGVVGLITGLILKRAARLEAWWPIWLLGGGWAAGVFLGWNIYYTFGQANTVPSVTLAWLINGLAAMLAVRNRGWIIAVLTAATAAIVFILLVGDPWGADAISKLASVSDALPTLALTALAAGGVLSFLLYRRTAATDQI